LPTILSEEPLIVQHEEFLKPDEIKELIEIGRVGAETTTVVDNETGDSTYSNYRTGKLGYVKDGLPIAEKIMSRIVDITNVRRCQIEGLQVLWYGVAQQYLPHTDFFHPQVKGSQKLLKWGGQRIISVVMSLQPAEEGGEFDFPQLKITRKLNAGDAILFWNLDRAGRGDMRTEHAAMPVVKGEKISLVCWIRERSFDGKEEKAPLPTETELKGMLQQGKNARQIEAAKAIEQVLSHFKCKVHLLVKPTVDPKTGLLMMKQDFRVEAF
jgi:prolyl 4-hydroxylase